MIRRSSIKQSLVTAGVFGLLAAIMIAPLSNANYAPDNADFFNHLAAIVQAHIALMQGQFPLRDALLNAFNLRYPFFQFYSPTTYLITSIIYHLSGTQNPIVTYEFTLWLWMVIGGCYLFRLGCWLFASRAIAYVVGVVFITSPYFITVNNHLFGFNEGIALSIIPIVLFYLIQSISLPTRLSSVVALSLAIYLLITTHLITFVNTTLIVSILLVAMMLKKQLYTRSLLNIFAAYLFACLLAAWYLAPIALLSHALIAAQSFSDPELFQSRHPPLLGLLSFTANYLLGNDAQTTVKIIPAIGWPILLSFFICVNYLTKTQLLVRHQRAQQWLPYLIVTFSICFLLAWSPINIWKYLPSQLRVSEYSWRLLGQLSWLGALLAGYAISWYAKTKLSRIKAGVCIALLLCIANSWLTIIDNKFVPLSKAFVSDPKLLFNTSAYLIDTKKHPEFISHIDNVVLDSLYSGNTLKLDTPYHIPPALMSYTVAPAIDLQLTISKAPVHLQLYVLLNKKIIKRIPMVVGKLQQHVLIEKSQLKPNSDNSIEIQFSAPLKNASDLDMHIASIVLTGFYDPKALMNIDLTEKYCSSKQTIVTCSIPTTQSTRLIELPMHYFPALLEVKLNGQRIAYEGILRNGYALMVITPEAGKVNEITLQMIGLTWANWLSRMSWGLLLCAMLYLLIQKLSNYFRFRFN